jgi:hypothetical protein
MRIRTLTILLVAIGAVPSAAQDSRFSFDVGGGPSATSPIFDHAVFYSGIGSSGVTDRTRLSIDDATIVTGRIAYRLDGPWTVVGELGRGSTNYSYRLSSVATGGGSSTTEQRGHASLATFSLGVARHSMLAAIPLFIEPELTIAMQRLRVGDPEAFCMPTPPSAGQIGGCPAPVRWQRTYSVPSVGAGLSLGYAIVPQVAVQVHGQYAVGRTSTKEAFYDDLAPQYDFAEAPKSQTVRSSYVSVGLRIAP